MQTATEPISTPTGLDREEVMQHLQAALNELLTEQLTALLRHIDAFSQMDNILSLPFDTPGRSQ